MRRTVLLFVSLVALQAAPSALAATGPVGSWRLNEGSGTVVHDASGRGNDGVLSGAAQWVAGVDGSALGFDGRTGRVQIPDSAALDPQSEVTVAVWVRASEPQGPFQYILAKGASRCVTASYGLYTGPNSGLMFYVAEDQGRHYTRSPDAGAGVWDGHWHFVVGTYDGTSVRLYLDGAEVDHGSPHSGPIDYDFPDNDLFIGHYNKCPGLDFRGLVDEPQVWDRALTASEIGAEYRNPTEPSDGGSSPAAPPAAPPQSSTPLVPAGPGSTSPSGPASQHAVGAARATIGNVSLSGLTTGKPKVILRLTVLGSAPIKSVAFSLPSGLSFAHDSRRMRRGVSLAHVSRYTLSLSRGRLVVVLGKPASNLAVTVGAPALIEAPGLAKRARAVVKFNRLRQYAKKKVLTLGFGVRLTDAMHKSSVFGARVRFS